MVDLSLKWFKPIHLPCVRTWFILDVVHVALRYVVLLRFQTQQCENQPISGNEGEVGFHALDILVNAIGTLCNIPFCVRRLQGNLLVKREIEF